MADAKSQDPRNAVPGTPEPAGGATGVFKTLGPEPSGASSADDELARLLGLAPTPAVAKVEPEADKAPAETIAAPVAPVLHQMVFKAEAGTPAESEALRNVMRASSAARTSEPAVPAKQPVTEKEPPAQGQEGMPDGGFTQLLGAFSPAAAAPATPAKGAVASVHSPLPVDSMSPPGSAPAAPPASSTAAAEPEPGSFTRLFTSFAVPSTPPPSAPAAPTPSPAPAAPEPPSHASEGSFTQLFSAFGTETQSHRQDPPEASAPAGASSQHAAVEAFPTVPAPATEPASFTQLFSAVTTPATAPPHPPPPHFNEASSTPSPLQASPATQQTASPESFTQMFQALSPRAETAGQELPRAASPFADPPATRNDASLRQGPAEPQGGTFTQLFNTLDDQREPGKPQDKGFADPGFAARPLPPGPSGVSAQSDLGASQVFSSLRASPPAPQTPSFSPLESSASQPPAAGPRQTPGFPSSQAAPGELTRLLRSLGQETVPAAAPAAYRPPLAAQDAGSDARLDALNSRGAAPVPYPSAPVVPQPAAPSLPAQPQFPASASSGPSEFTRIMNASALREAALRETGAAPANAAAPAAPQLAASVKLPELKAPEVKLPEVKSPEPAATMMQKYLPLLLILIILLLVGILAVVLLMKK